MKVINLFSGPGAGKSTTASGLFFQMKLRDMEVELVTEYAKKLSWQKRHNTLKDQFYVTATQNHRMEILREQVEWCITDSPILLGMYYSPTYFPNTFPNFIVDMFKSYDNRNFFINRTKVYNPNGRNQTEDEAHQADKGIMGIMDKYGIEYDIIDGDKDAPMRILSRLMAEGSY